MGYNTTFQGKLEFVTPLTGPDIAYLNTILGEDCRHHDEWIPAFLEIPAYDTEHRYSGLTYIDLELTSDFNGLEWNGGEKTYDLVDKVNLVIALMRERVASGFELQGVLLAQGEDLDDRWELFIDYDGWAYRRDLPIAGEIQTCPNCGHQFPSE